MGTNIQSNSPLLQLILKKQIYDLAISSDNVVQNDTVNNETSVSNIVDKMIEANKNATIYSIADDAAKKATELQIPELVTKTDNCSGKILKIEDVNNNKKIKTSLSISIDELPEPKIENIKKIIYDLHHKKPDDTPDPEDKPKPSFLDEFDDVESMFEWLHEKDPTISAENGLTRSQLIALTQDDVWEDANHDFFGSLNRIFNVLDKDSDSILTVDEIKKLIGEEIGDSYDDYKAKVDAYAAELESYYETLDIQGKLEFSIDRAREYFEAAGLYEQLEALERLVNGVDQYSDVKLGNISIRDLNPDYKGEEGERVTFGAYSMEAWVEEYNGGNIKMFASDYDTAEVDRGLVLDIRLLNGNWYSFVGVLIHELTHAKAFLYSWAEELGDGNYKYSKAKALEVAQRLYDNGIMSKDEYDYYKDNIASISFNSEEFKRLKYLASTARGEYAAYQAGADYGDSVAEDIYKSYIPIDDRYVFQIPGLTDGVNEKNEIDEHIKVGYPNEVLPDWKWWSYA